MRPAAQRARRLTRRLVTAAAALAGAALAYGILAGRDDDLERVAAGDERGYYLVDATLTELGPSGTPRIVLRAMSIEQQLADRSVLLSDLELDYHSPGAGAWQVTADRGRLPEDATSLLLSGNVLVTGSEARGTAVIRTDNLTYDTRTSVVQTAEPVTVEFGRHWLQGRGMRVVLNTGILRLESNVHGLFTP